MTEGKWISYLRVSTKRQGKSGLGLEAQRHAVEEFLNGGNWSLVKEFVEVESGKRTDRPRLEASLKACRAYERQPCQAPAESERHGLCRRRYADRQPVDGRHHGDAGGGGTAHDQQAHQGRA